MTFDELFALAPSAEGEWQAPAVPQTDEPRLFGGVLIGQAIAAASMHTRRCHALHAFFVSVGAMGRPFDIAVTPMRDGGSFATRRFDISQRGLLLLAGHSSHHEGDDGPARQVAMPDLPPPERLEDQRTLRARRADTAGKAWRRYLTDEMLDVRPIELPPDEATNESRRAIWFRPRAPIQGGLALHQATIGFASDTGLVHVGLLAHGRAGGGPLQAASLDHSIWFHRNASANEWMLHVQRSPTTAHGRGLSYASVFSRNGVLVASVAQEILARARRE